MLTSKEYADKNGTTCPHCSGNNVETVGSLDAIAGYIYQDCKCRGCDAIWTDEYKLTGYSTDGEDDGT